MKLNSLWQFNQEPISWNCRTCGLVVNPNEKFTLGGSMDAFRVEHKYCNDANRVAWFIRDLEEVLHRPPTRNELERALSKPNPLSFDGWGPEKLARLDNLLQHAHMLGLEFRLKK